MTTPELKTILPPADPSRPRSPTFSCRWGSGVGKAALAQPVLRRAKIARFSRAILRGVIWSAVFALFWLARDFARARRAVLAARTGSGRDADFRLARLFPIYLAH